MDFAVKITEDNLYLITQANEGVTPKIEKGPTYFLTSDRPDKYNLILPERVFRAAFTFVESELENQFAEIKNKT